MACNHRDNIEGQSADDRAPSITKSFGPSSKGNSRCKHHGGSRSNENEEKRKEEKRREGKRREEKRREEKRREEKRREVRR